MAREIRAGFEFVLTLNRITDLGSSICKLAPMVKHGDQFTVWKGHSAKGGDAKSHALDRFSGATTVPNGSLWMPEVFMSPCWRCDFGSRIAESMSTICLYLWTGPCVLTTFVSWRPVQGPLQSLPKRRFPLTINMR